MTHYRGIRAQRQAALRNADLPSEDDDPRDFPDTEFQDVGVLIPEPVELYTLANPKEQQS